MARTKSTKVPRASTARAKSAAKRTRDVLKEMLSDANATLNAIGDVIANMPTHGDLHDEHLELAKSVKKLAKETHSRLKAAREAAKKATP